MEEIEALLLRSPRTFDPASPGALLVSRWRILLLVLVILVGLGLFAVLTTVQPVWGRDTCEAAPVDAARLEAHVRLLSQTLVPRDSTHPENLERVAAWLRAEFERMGLKVEEQRFRVDGHEYLNVRTRVGPASASRVVVGAHYDAWSTLPGADDNASGVAGLVELARLLVAHPPPGEVELVGYTLEEPPYFRTPEMGSAVHADSLASAHVPVKAMLSLEMIGYFSDAPGSQAYPAPLLEPFYPSEGHFIAVVGKRGQGGTVRQVKRAMRGASPLPVEAITAPPFVTGVDFSDHLNYWAHGFEAVMITDTSFMRNASYHEATDTADRLDFTRMAQVVQGVDCAVRALARDAAMGP